MKSLILIILEFDFIILFFGNVEMKKYFYWSISIFSWVLLPSPFMAILNASRRGRKGELKHDIQRREKPVLRYHISNNDTAIGRKKVFRV